MIKRLIGKILNSYNREIVRRPSITHSQLSVIVPAEVWKSQPNDRLIDVSMQAISYARSVDHSDIAAKMEEYPHWPTIWPGEHYKLLSGIIQTLQPKLVIEIGTATGYSSLAMKKFLPKESKIVTFDIVPWKQFPKCILRDEDFQDGRLEQIIADLSDEAVFSKYTSLLSNADFIFIDAAKDGIQEQLFINNFSKVPFRTQPIFMFDDIRLMNMVEIWNNLARPKLDLTSFGHWAGTGLVSW